LSNGARRRVLDELGRAGSQYRAGLYSHGLSASRVAVAPSTLVAFFGRALAWVDHSIDANRRPDGLYHAYNLMRVERGGIVIRRLYEMLEGQVAVLSSGRLSSEQAVALMHALRHSAIYRADQHSYLLYPNRRLPQFVDRNNLPVQEVRRSKLLRQLMAAKDRSLVERDVRGRLHFAGSVSNARDVARVLDELARAGSSAAKAERGRMLMLFERLFDHESFTGRSGTFFGYEGLGSIYWHMVSKLLLAVQETFYNAPPASRGELARAYWDVRAGLGDQKAPDVYGAFPMDPYSHTPAHAGARQPGLTGQVKEDILCRFGELGVRVGSGRIYFEPVLLQDSEFLGEQDELRYYDVKGVAHRLRLKAGSLGFTYCQVPVVYERANRQELTVTLADGTHLKSTQPMLDSDLSRSVFERSGKISRITVGLTR
jgi:hypothetical protein